MAVIGNPRIQINLDVVSTQASVGTFETGVSPLKYGLGFSLDEGSGLNAINYAWSYAAGLGANSSEDIDLSGGITNAFGETLTLTKVKMILFANITPVSGGAQDSNVVRLRPKSSNGFSSWIGGTSSYIELPSGVYVEGVRAPACFMLVNHSSAGYAVTAGTGDILQVFCPSGNSGTTSYALFIWGS